MALKIWPPIDSSHNVDNGWIIDMIEKEWPETARLWNKRRRCDELCKSPEAKEWQCGCLGPEGCYCHRLRNHQGQCSDLLNEEDRQSLVKKIKALQKEEFDQILGQKPCKSRSFSSTDLKKALRDE